MEQRVAAAARKKERRAAKKAARRAAAQQKKLEAAEAEEAQVLAGLEEAQAEASETPPADASDAVVATSPRARIVESCRRGAASPRATASPSADDARAPSRIARAARARAANRRRPDMARGCVRRVAATNIATLQREWIVSFRARLV